MDNKSGLTRAGATIDVSLQVGPDRSYPIIIERGIIDGVGKALAAILDSAGNGSAAVNGSAAGSDGATGSGVTALRRCAIITNPFVGGLYGDRLRKGLDEAGFDHFTIELGDGEEFKTLGEASSLYDRLIEERFERGGMLIALGGGVVGDMTGFVAATYLRGVPYVQVPTTLLAQVDSSVGGKTAVNHPKGKNLIGAFYQPRAVFIDPLLLKTLERRELGAGLAEVIKYGVIWNEGFFNYLADFHDEILTFDKHMDRAIERACEIKANIVATDEREAGLRSILNFGHTFGHAIEAVTGYTRFKHGEVVAIGMVMASALSERLGICEGGVTDRIRGLLDTFGLPVEASGLGAEDLVEAMTLDKKVIDGRMRFVLVKELGKVALEEVGRDEVEAFLKKGNPA